MKYRKEIDGLRAIAVIPVMFFHAGFEVFSGGYIGVDVFFVISGYLITSLIISELEQGKFSISNFYERRARRILPALSLVVLCCMPFSWIWMSPSQFVDFSRSVVAVTLFLSNIFFWREDGYFAETSDEKPLLHTWSLAVEEQYYIFFPLLIIFLFRFGLNRIVYSIVGLMVISFYLNLWSLDDPNISKTATFYLTPTRAWELFAGSMCAFILRGGQKSSNMLSGIGLLLIAFSVFYFDEFTPFPSVYALAPVLGASLIIVYAARDTWTASILSTKLAVDIGLISYSAYLWHQPLFAFARIRSIAPPNHLLMFCLVMASLMLAYLSWRFVELPFRSKTPNGRYIISKKRVFHFSAIVSAFFLTVGGLFSAIHGLNDRIVDKKSGITLSAIDEIVAENRGLHHACNGKRSFYDLNCRTSNEPQLAVWGDSYAMHLVHALIAANPDTSLIQYTRSNCAPFFGISWFKEGTDNDLGWAKSCISFNEKVFSELVTRKTLNTVVISSPFKNFIDANYDLVFSSGEIRKAGKEEALAAINSTLYKLRMAGKKVVVISPTPDKSGHNIGRCIVKRLQFRKDINACDFSVADISEDHRLVNSFLAEIDGAYKVVFLQKMICETDSCEAVKDNVILYRDEGHLTRIGSSYLGKKFKSDFSVN